MTLDAKVKTAMDETRLLILGAQILLGCQFNATFQDAFDTLRDTPRTLQVAAFAPIAPTAFHRIRYGGEDSEEFHRHGARLHRCAPRR